MRLIVVILLLMSTQLTHAQDTTSKWSAHLSIGQYPLSLLTPSFSVLHPGVNAGVTYQWNSNKKHQFIQTGNIGYFYHKDVQSVLHIFTEAGYRLQLDNGLQISPLMLGGGYALSNPDMTSVVWNPETSQYEEEPNDIRHNWLISLGSTIGYQSGLTVANKPLSFFIDYRLQVQGILIKSTVPVAIYSPLRVGVAIGL